MEDIFKSAIIVSLVIATYAVCFHAITVNPNDWNAVALWLPVYISPIWGIAGASWYSERRHIDGNN